MSRDTKALIFILLYGAAAFAWGMFIGYKLAELP